MIATTTMLPLLARLMARRQSSSTTSPIALRMGRGALPALCRDLRFTHGAEIGVWKGAFSAAFCEQGIHMLCVDPWVSYPAWLDTKNSMPHDQATAFMESAHQTAMARLAPFSNCTIIRQFSKDAAPLVRDASLDFVFIDGNHVYDAVLEDLTLWAPKVKSGGFVAGHDFRHFDNKPTIHVIEAVQAYTQAHGIDPFFTLSGDRTPSFLWVVH